MKAQLLILFIIALSSVAANSPDMNEATDEELQAQEAWVDERFAALTVDEQIAQLLTIRAHSNLGIDHTERVKSLIKKYQVGGLCFFQGTPEKQAYLTNEYQALSTKIPLMISMDAEWGVGMRLRESVFSFPRQIMLGAIQDNRLIYEMGREVAYQFKRLGMQVNFAPVADVNNNAANPVINARSFGEDRYNVAAKCYMYMKGMQDGGIMACAKHFPGHGDTDVDSHHDLPVIPHPQSRLDSIELFPFQVLAEQGIGSMMVAHLHVPVIDDTPNLPTTLSKHAVGDLLIDKLGFDGLIYTDGLEMQGVAKHHKAGEVEAKAILAGNDIMLLPKDVEASIRTIKQYMAEGKISPQHLEATVKKVLRTKYQLGLQKAPEVRLANIREDLNRPSALALKARLVEASLTLVRNEDALIPLQDTDGLKIASLSLGSIVRTPFQKQLEKYTKLDHFNAKKDMTNSQRENLLRRLSDQDVVIVGLHDMSSSAKKNFGISVEERTLINDLRQRTKVVMTVFGNPYSLHYFDGVDHLLEAYDDEPLTQELAAQALFGAFSIRGRLPVTASAKAKFGDGVTTPAVFRLGYAIPEQVGLSATQLTGIDALMKQAIDTKATPGGVVLVAKDGKVVFNKAYGHHTYSRRQAMQTSDIFDLASVTKILASTLAVMKLHEQGKINVYQPLSEYLPELRRTDKASLSIYDIMSHRAGLKAWIPFFEQTVTKSRRNPRPSKKFYQPKAGGTFNTTVTEKLFMRDDFRDSIWQQIYDSPLRPTRDYKYSDLGFYLVKQMVERVSGQSFESFLREQYYGPMGLQTASFNPLQKFSKSRVVPTEEDKYWRRQRVHGYVHDMGAAMLGGVSGHAGLFANANDLAILLQMLLNGGYYGGTQYLRPETVRLFTTRHPDDTRRGVGFDMKELSPHRNANMSALASESTFGHLGFTGTSVWADPENNVLFVFLSNRTYPSMKNYKLSSEDYRPRIQSVVYEAMGEE